jgi:hypothetical protein
LDQNSGNTAETLSEITAILDSLLNDNKIDLLEYKAVLRHINKDVQMPGSSRMDKIERFLDRLSCKENTVGYIIGNFDQNGVLKQELPRTIHPRQDARHHIALQSLEPTSFLPNLTSENK